jgi:hypothetical protein
MKLHNILVLNSGNFSFAELTLDTDSIQIAGRNNRGKTSLLWTLPLLYVVDRKKALNPEYSHKETLHFYFPSQDKSYIIFEGFDERQGYFYMLLKRDGGDIRYYFVKKKFEIEHFMIDGAILSFKKVLENPHTGIGSPISTVREILSKVIVSNKQDVGFLRLSQRDANSRYFSELFMHHLRSKGDKKLLKNGILIALGLNGRYFDFGEKISSLKIEGWKRERSNIEKLKKVENQIELLKKSRDSRDEQKERLRSLLIGFEDVDFDKTMQMYQVELNALNNENLKLQKDIEELFQKNSVIKNEKEKITKDIGVKEVSLSEYIKKLDRAKSYESIEWLRAELKNSESKRDEIRRVIYSIETVGSISKVESNIEKFKLSIEQIERFIDNNEDTLVMNLSKNREQINIANTIFSDSIKGINRSAIKGSLKELNSKSFHFNGVEIDISSIKIKELPTIEERKELLLEKKKRLQEEQKIKEEFHKKEQLQKEWEKYDRDSDEIKRKIAERGNIENYEKSISDIEKRLSDLVDKSVSFEDDIESLSKERSTLSDMKRGFEDKISTLEDKNRSIGEFYQKYMDYCRKIDFELKSGKAYSIEELFLKIEQDKEIDQEYIELTKRDEKFLFTKESIERDFKGEDIYEDLDDSKYDLIEVLDLKCMGIQKREIELNDNITSERDLLSGGIKNFLKDLESIKQYIKSINRKISNYQISDLSSVTIDFIEREEQLSALESINIGKNSLFYDLTSDLNRGDRTLMAYIMKEKRFTLSDLFDINIGITKNNQNIKNAQSTGTKEMINSMLLLILMREMIDERDTIPFVIDEVLRIDDSNLDELLKFFSIYNFLPISASPTVASGFEKVYFIEEIGDKSYLSRDTSLWKDRSDG